MLLRNNVRIGFEFIDLTTNDRDVLASVTDNDPRVGKYFVNLTGCRFAADSRLSLMIKMLPHLGILSSNTSKIINFILLSE